MSVKCVCCGGEAGHEVLYRRGRCPATNNVVYETREEAVGCAVGGIELVRCGACGMFFNRAYNGELVDYGRGYDSVRSHSEVYRAYLEGLTETMAGGVEAGQKILEVGCGDGEFLRRLCSVTRANGVGYDPSCCAADGDEMVTLKDRWFDAEDGGRGYDAVVMRHVLEHVERPVEFLGGMFANGVVSREGRIWIEAPDFEWIAAKGAYYDITYEHCNYFTKESLGRLLIKAGFGVVKVEKVFGGQYLLAEAVCGGEASNKAEHQKAFSADEVVRRFDETARRHESVFGSGQDVCVWGASGKGVIFLSALSNEMLERVSYVVDVNPQKQGRYTGVSGKRIDGPEALRNAGGGLAVMVMNGVYEREIRAMLDEMGVEASVHVA